MKNSISSSGLGHPSWRRGTRVRIPLWSQIKETYSKLDINSKLLIYHVEKLFPVFWEFSSAGSVALPLQGRGQWFESINSHYESARERYEELNIGNSYQGGL